MNVQISERAEAGPWNQYVSSFKWGSVFQTTHWADYKRDAVKADPRYLTVTDDSDNVVASLLFFKEPKGQNLLSGMPLSSITLKITKYLKPTNTWLFGPLVSNDDVSVLDSVLKEMDSYKTGTVMPPIHDFTGQDAFRQIFEKHKYKSLASTTFFIDLNLSEEQLWANLKKTARKAVKSCEGLNLKVELAKDKKDLKEYYDLFVESRKRLKLSPPSPSSFEASWEHLHKNNCMDIFMVRKDGLLLSAMGVVHFNGVMREVAAAQSEYSMKNKIYANDLLKWSIIKWGRENKFRIYDLAGVVLNSKDQKEEHIYQFKAKWGGRLVQFDEYHKVR